MLDNIVIERTTRGNHIVRNAETDKNLFEGEMILSIEEVYEKLLKRAGVEVELHDHWYLQGEKHLTISKLV